MPLNLNTILSKGPGMAVVRPGSTIIMTNKRGYTPVSGDERKFIEVHKVKKSEDRVGNNDDVYNAQKVRMFDRWANRFGYNPRQDQDAEFVADKSKDKKEVATEETIDRDMQKAGNSARYQYKQYYENEIIYEATQQKACAMAQELANKDRESYFVHSFTHPESKETRYGVVKKNHYDSDYNKYGYHLTHIVHPDPIKPLKGLPKLSKSTKNAIRVSNEEHEPIINRSMGKALSDIIRKDYFQITQSTKDAYNTSSTDGGSTNKDVYFQRTNSSSAAVNAITNKGLSTDTNRNASFQRNNSTSRQIQRDTNAKSSSIVDKSKSWYADGDEPISERRRFIPRRKIVNSQPDQNKKDLTVQNSKSNVVENIDEKLDLANPVGNYIHHFVNSKNSRFDGKSKAERIQMALGAFYHNKKSRGAK